MKPSKRLDLIPPYLFAELERKIAAKRAAGHRRHLAGHRRPRPPDAGDHRRRDAGGGHRARDAPVPVQPRPPGLPPGRVGLLHAPLRRRARPRHRGHAGDRRQGVHLQPQPRVPGPGRRGAERRSRVPRLHRRAADGRRRAGAHAAAARARLHARPERDLRRRPRAREAHVLQLSEQPDGRGRAPRVLRGGRRRSRATTTSSPSTTTPTPRRPTTATARRRSSRRRAPRRSASRSSRGRRATT